MREAVGKRLAAVGRLKVLAFHATGPMDTETWQNAVDGLVKFGIAVECIDLGDRWAGEIRAVRCAKQMKERPDYRVSINRNHDPSVRFVTLVHELIHLFLGHPGADAHQLIAVRCQIRAGEHHGRGPRFLPTHRGRPDRSRPRSGSRPTLCDPRSRYARRWNWSEW